MTDPNYQEPIVTSGGWCASPSPLYDYLPPQPLSLPIFKASRGGIKVEEIAQLSKKDIKFLSMAMGVATQSTCKFKHGAIVVKHGRVLGASPNIQKNDPAFVNHKFSQVHAEINAMRKAGWPVKTTVYVSRINSFGKAMLSRPCANCKEVLDSYKCKVVWTQ